MSVRSKLVWSGALLLAIVIAACVNSSVHTPPGIAGNIPLVVVNNQPAGNPICAIAMLAINDTNPSIDNMLGKTQLAPGAQVTFGVRPGTYKFVTSNCQITGNQGDSHYGSYMAGTVSKLDPFQVSGPTYLSVGGRGRAAPPGYRAMTLNTQIQRTAVCSAPRDTCDAATRCCSGARCRAGICP